jgi:hypothetical protein
MAAMLVISSPPAGHHLISFQSMAPFDLNQEPPHDPDVIWDGIQEWDGPAHELQYDLVWDDDGDEGERAISSCVSGSFDLFGLICLFSLKF